jgi:hypothetical protein
LCVAQAPTSAATRSQAAAGANPVTSTVKQIVERQERNIMGAAEAMPADKYDYKPTPQQITYGALMAHIAESNFFLCSKIGDVNASENSKVEGTSGKEKIVTALKDSFQFCHMALEKVDDAKLSDEVTMFRGRKAPRAAALIELTNDFADHYAAAAGYLRLNGILPPSAQRQQSAAAGERPKQ